MFWQVFFRHKKMGSGSPAQSGFSKIFQCSGRLKKGDPDPGTKVGIRIQSAFSQQNLSRDSPAQTAFLNLFSVFLDNFNKRVIRIRA
jgi:hypothetical protein